MFLNRHVIKYIIGRKVTWYDLAFFDPVMFESLRQMVQDAESSSDPAAMFDALDLSFVIEAAPEEVLARYIWIILDFNNFYLV
jgi:E3 ubiquitin-protein ligase EDD1